jgi:acylphosphatase
METVAYQVMLEGRVTGVGFRWSAVMYARKFGCLKGYVSNVDYGKVEAVVQGPEDYVELMLEWLGHGPSFARVDRMTKNRIPVSGFLTDFDVR